MVWHFNNLTTLTGQRAIFGLTALVNPNDVHAHNPTKHVFFLGRQADGSDDGHIHEFRWDGNGPLQHSDLTSKTSAAPAAGVPLSYMYKGKRTKHVIYEALDFSDPGRIHELLWDVDGNWYHHDLTGAAGNAPRTIGEPFGYEYSFFDTIHQRNIMSQRVVYQGRLDGRIHLLSRLDNSQWQHTALPSATASRPKAYVFTVQGQAVQGLASQRVLYQLPDANLIDVRHVHELMLNEKGLDIGNWVHNDLTVLSGAPQPDSSFQELVGFMHDLESTLHVFYLSTGRLFELWWNNLGWHENNLTALTGTPPAAASPLAYVHMYHGTLNVIYPGVDGHIHAVWRGQGSTWNTVNYNDLTITAGGAPPMVGNPVGFVFRDLYQHIFYIAATSPNSHIGDVIELTDE
jgi:hypothetical protein